MFENGILLAFLDARPLFPGHVLLVPKDHFETLSDLPEDLTGPLFLAARTLSKVVIQAMEAEGSFVAINNHVSQSVLHLHVHIVPRRKGDGLKGFFWPRVGYRDREHLLEVGARIRRTLETVSESEPGMGLQQ